MPSADSQGQDSLLYTYRIASGDMRYIDINTREIYLRQDPDQGFVIRGDIPECRPSCYATLSMVFLEYAMSCKGFECSSVMMESTAKFGEQLGGKVASLFLTQYPDKTSQEIVSLIFDCILPSMESKYHKESTLESLKITFLEPPLATTAEVFGLQLWISPAYQGLVAFFEAILNSVGGGWTLLSPKLTDSENRLEVISLQKAAQSSEG